MQLEPVAIFLDIEVAEGWLVAQDRRPSERLNAGEPLHVQLVTANAEPGPWADYHPDNVIAVAVAPMPPSPLRVSRRRHVMELSAPPYVFSGTAHIPPGADPLRYAASAARRWLPLTGCTVTRREDTWAVDVLLLNLDQVSRAQTTPLQDALFAETKASP